MLNENCLPSSSTFTLKSRRLRRYRLELDLSRLTRSLQLNGRATGLNSPGGLQLNLTQLTCGLDLDLMGRLSDGLDLDLTGLYGRCRLYLDLTRLTGRVLKKKVSRDIFDILSRAGKGMIK